MLNYMFLSNYFFFLYVIFIDLIIKRIIDQAWDDYVIVQEQRNFLDGQNMKLKQLELNEEVRVLMSSVSAQIKAPTKNNDIISSDSSNHKVLKHKSSRKYISRSSSNNS